MTHAEACHAAFDRAGLWHWVGEGRRLEHFIKTGRWQPPREGGETHRLATAARGDSVTGGGASGANTPWEGWG